ncbi:MAG: undecaprenyl phosphate translocase family protein, partial [Culicoidibacterales bacterium]
MKFKNLLEWKNIYRGMLVGAADLVPGVSGGTIAVLLGIYDELLD